ncbi:MAG: biotin--[acetyl-CoA-carboxylase] ligase, partial [Bacilli bacterium]|nr:biotin--[acetyl-CoA-carboxylase] ligase [Bacilli bacterium]
IKWPNDILLNGKKCCGILTESRLALGKLSYYIVGIGVNVNLPAEAVPLELQSVITSIGGEAGEPVSRVKLVQSILQELEKFYELFIKEGFSAIRNSWLSYRVSDDLLTADIYRESEQRYTDVEV